MNLLKHSHLNSIWMLLLSYTGGIIISAHTDATLWINYRWQLVLFTATILLSSCHSQRIRPATALAFLAFILGAGHYTAALHPASDTTDLSQFCTQHEVNIHANVITIDPQPDKWRMDVALEQISDHNMNIPVHGKLRVQVLSHTVDTFDRSRFNILPGDHIVFRAKLYKPRLLDLPAEFNYPRYLAGNNIFTCATVKDSTSIIHMGSEHSGWRQTIERWRCRVGRAVEGVFTPEQSAYLLSLTLGQKTRLSQAQRQQLAAYGISHLFSISGLHMGLLAWFLYQIINYIYRRSEYLLLRLPAQIAAPFLALPLIFFYLLFSGAAIPTTRAALIVALGVLALFTQRHTSPLNLLAMVALIILGVDPLALFTASFQLSFAGVSAILFFLPRIKQQWQSRATRLVLLPFWLTLIATMATTPIALWHFHTLAPAALVCNLFAIPVIGMCALPLALLGILSIGLPLGISFELLRYSNWLIELTLKVAQQIAQGPLAAKMLFLSPVQYLLIALCCMTILCASSKSKRSCTIMTLASALLWLSSCWQPTPPPLQLTAFSIGQGDAMLLHLGKNKTYLIDGGGFYSPTFDVGQRLLAPALGYLGIHRLDAVILSHDHPDHRKGLIYILRTFNVEQFWCSIPVEELHYTLQQVLAERSIPVTIFAPGWTRVSTEPATTLDIFVPSDQRDNMNDRSLALLAHHDQDGVLLTGDLEQHGIEQLLAQPLPGPVTLLKLPHHGSRRSVPQLLFNTTQPKIAIASAGYGNSYGFPHAEVITEARNHNTELIRTDLDGTMQLSSWGKGWTATKL